MKKPTGVNLWAEFVDTSLVDLLWIFLSLSYVTYVLAFGDVSASLARSKSQK